jgi:hypothetical protein
VFSGRVAQLLSVELNRFAGEIDSPQALHSGVLDSALAHPKMTPRFSLLSVVATVGMSLC